MKRLDPGSIHTGSYEMVLIEEEGFVQFAPVSYLEADPAVVDKKTGGCGPGKFGDLLVPDRLLGESVFLSCRKHDWMYGEAQTAEDKFWSDFWFLANMVLQVNDGEHLDNPRLELAMKYYRAVSFLGGDFVNTEAAT